MPARTGILIFSPTFYLDDNMTSVLNVRGVLKKYPLESPEETINLVSPQRERQRHTGKIRENDVYTEYDEEVLADLVESQKEFQLMYGKSGMPNVPIVFEDAGGLNLFSGKTGTRYIKLITTLRHYNI